MPPSDHQRAPRAPRPGELITAEFLSRVVDALVQRITIPGGTVTRIGQSAVLTFPQARRGGGFAGFIGLVTARYGPFVTVSRVEGDVNALAESTPAEVTEYVWCLTEHHPWLPNSIDLDNPPNDYVLVLPAPGGLTFPDPDASSPDAVIAIQWLALGTVPEADLRLFRGAEPDCFFTPYDAGCTLLPVTEQDYPEAP